MAKARKPRKSSLRAFIDAMPGVTSTVFSMGKAQVPVSVIHKVQGKMFAIQSLRGEEYVILKCDPMLVPALKQQYKGVGHRSHLDRRFWIAVSLDADVPGKEVRRLVAHSYGLVVAGLTRKQQAAVSASR